MLTNQIWSKCDKKITFLALGSTWTRLGATNGPMDKKMDKKMAVLASKPTSACYFRPTKKFETKLSKNWTKDDIISFLTHRPAWANPTGQFGISINFVSSFVRRVKYPKISPIKIHFLRFLSYLFKLVFLSQIKSDWVDFWICYASNKTWHKIKSYC